MSIEKVLGDGCVNEEGELGTPPDVLKTVKTLAPKGSSVKQVKTAMEMAAELAQAKSQPKPTRVK